MIETLGWDTLEHRRAVAFVLIDPGENLCKQTRKSRHVKSHAFKKIQCKTESHRLSFYPRTIEKWNSLPDGIFLRSSTSQALKLKFQNM